MATQSQTLFRQPVDDHASWLRYEELKRIYTSAAENQQQFEAACRRAAMEAGV